MLRHIAIALTACGMATLSSYKDNSLFMSQQAEDRAAFWEMHRLKELASKPEATVATGVEYDTAITAENELKSRICAIDETRSKEWIKFLQNSQSAHEAMAATREIKRLRALAKETEQRGEILRLTSAQQLGLPCCPGVSSIRCLGILFFERDLSS